MIVSLWFLANTLWAYFWVPFCGSNLERVWGRKQDHWACRISSRWPAACQVVSFREALEGKTKPKNCPIGFLAKSDSRMDYVLTQRAMWLHIVLKASALTHDLPKRCYLGPFLWPSTHMLCSTCLVVESKLLSVDTAFESPRVLWI